MNVSEVDQAARQAWPALEEQHHPFGVLRYAQGVTRRSNSLNLFPESLYNPIKLIEATERFFQSKAQPSIVRVPKLNGKSAEAFKILDQLLDKNGYELEAPSKLMILDLCDHAALNESAGEDSMQACDFQRWLSYWHEFTERSQNELEVHLTTLAKIRHPAKFILLKNGAGEITSCGMGVVSGQGLGLYGIATCKNGRNLGYGRRLIEALINWGQCEGARYAYLQVEAENQSACKLYRKIGFREFYSYWYRVKHLTSQHGVSNGYY